MKKLAFILGLGVFALTSCKKNLPDIGGTSAQAMANEWWVQLKLTDGSFPYGKAFYKIGSYNTAANQDSIWIDDFHNVWDFKVKAKADFNSLTFATTAAKNENYNITVDIKNGKILPKAGHSRSGNVTDSIYMETKFSDDPRTFVLAGHARTMFIEDEY